MQSTVPLARARAHSAAWPPFAVYPSRPAPPPRTLLDILEATAARFPAATAIDDGRQVMTYSALIDRLHELCGRLAAAGMGRGDRIGVRVCSGTAELYVAILAVLALGAAYVPVDFDDPDERAELVWAEAGVCAVIGDRYRIGLRPVAPCGAGPGRPRPSDDAWIIFTSGSTGKPKGVAVTHRSAAAWVDAEAHLFQRRAPLGPRDRVLAGLSVAFDASCEEMWLAWRHGGCLVPASRTLVKMGTELGPWLVARGISVVSTVPTLAALWPTAELRGVRLLILGGEACPPELAARLASICPQVWNTYGPTETTVVASATQLTGIGPVRIGLPLDGWQLAVIDPHSGQPVGWGETGELVIAGIGTARYLDLDKDAATFRRLPCVGWERAYHSGDMVRADPEGLTYLGRLDSQVKIRGYRIELAEIESVLLRLPGVAQAAVTTHQPHPGLVELVAYVSPAAGRGPLDPRGLHQRLRERLPAHMVPAHLEELAVLPTMTSGKIDRKSLPPPRRRPGPGAGQPHARPATPIEAILACELAEVLNLERVAVDAHFFDDLGANSLVLAHFCAQARERPELPSLAIKDVYLNPTIRSLAAVLAPSVSGSGTDPVTAPLTRLTQPMSPTSAPTSHAGTAQHLVCGAAQLLLLLGAAAMTGFVVNTWLRWVGPATGALDTFLRSALFIAVTFTALSGLPIVAKWVLVGRWQPVDIPVWSAGYLRFWTVKTLIRTNPMVLFVGSPLYVAYLRALGARIGRGVTIFSPSVPVCTDLITVGDGTLIRNGTSFTGYRAEAGVLRTGPVTLGRDVLVGEGSVLDVGTAIGEGGQLGHSSALHPGQTIPAGESWHGCPAQRTDLDYRAVPTARCGGIRRTIFALVQLVNVFVLTPALATAALLGVKHFAMFAELLDPQPAVAAAAFSPPQLLQEIVWSSTLFFGIVALGPVVLGTVPRVLSLALEPGRVYPLYGTRYWIYRLVTRLTNTPFFINLFGDSSYITGYLRLIGYRIPRSGQTGSNFGAALRHATPFLCSVGADTMLSDGVALVSADFSSTSFRTASATIGSHTFLGNAITYPAGGKVGHNCLVGTKTLVPVHGAVREDVGLLGSPSFEIPRSTQRDSKLELSRAEFRQRLGAKNRHNVMTMALFLLTRWLHLHVLMLIGIGALTLDAELGTGAIAVGIVAAAIFSFGYSVLMERVATGFRPLRPQFCSIYDSYFWWHERYWKLSTQPAVLNGTPFKSLVWRLLGVRIGKRAFDDGCGITEKTLVRIGDDCTLGAGSTLQAHSMEDGIFKADHITIGSNCTVGIGAFVHYGASIADHAVITTDAFVMKGEHIAAATRWSGNPARPVS
jgi:non-ribosomal peptide synthetase-like protein